MNTESLHPDNCATTSTFQYKWDHFSKQCAVLLAFVVPISTAATNLVLLFLIPAWFLAGNLQTKAKMIGAHPIARLVLLLFGVFLLSAVYSNGSPEAVMGTLGKMAKLLYIPFLLPLMIEDKWRTKALNAFMAAMVFTLILCLLKANFNLPIGNKFGNDCVFKDHIYTSLLMAFASFIAGHSLLNNVAPLKRWVGGALLGSMIFYLLFMNTGRSGQVVFIALWVLLCLQRFALRYISLGLLGLVLLIGFAYAGSKPFQQTSALAIQNVEHYNHGMTNTSVGARLEFTVQTWKLIKQHPWLGYGVGSFKAIYQDHAKHNHLLETNNPHNEYLNIFFQTGIFGLSVFIALLVSIFKNSYRLPNREKWLAQGVMLVMLIGSIANSWLMDFTAGYFFVALMAFCFGAYQNKKDLHSE